MNKTALVAVVALLGIPAMAMDEDPSPGFIEGATVAGAEIGRIEYMAGCAQCHGLDGKGDGIIAPYLSVELPDLTRIQAENDGVFPAGTLYEIIEGGGGVGAHGSREMPAWGDRFSAQAYAVLGWPHDAEERAAFIRGRILALIEYVASIQTE
jgi:mono/diheme cytochrome c family protein